MLKIINADQLNQARDIEFKCENCEERGIFHLENALINTDNSRKPVESLGVFECPNCQFGIVE